MFSLRLISFLMCLAVSKPLHSQYFQQEVNYTIEARLDDSLHRIDAHIAIEYHNNAPFPLEQIYIHLWPNAYANRSTHFAKRAVQSGNLDFHFADPGDRGSIGGLDFRAGSREMSWRYDTIHKDIAILYLHEPLPAGESVVIETPFTLKIPKSFSRFGRVGKSYQITQWYPKPAVLDTAGWHPMPYTNQGEFYSEFGRFHVSIDVPADQVVAATGKLINEDAIAFRAAIVNRPFDEQAIMKSMRKGRMRWEFVAENVHDFAWFTDPDFIIRRDTVMLENGHRVACWACYPPEADWLWSEVTTYLADATRFYSTVIGPYPYSDITAVQSTYSEGIDMEYPMITLIGPAFDSIDLEEVIAHEVGHNWFYGMLGNDERRVPWMDESITSYYTWRYMLERHRYPFFRATYQPRVLSRNAILSDEQLALGYMARHKALQSSGLHSEAYSPMNYYFDVYNRPMLAFGKLADYMGEEIFDKAMQAYFDTWQYRHPRPGDLRSALEDGCNCDLSWFFDNLFASAEIPDMVLKAGEEEGELTLERRSGLAIPVKLIGTMDSGDTTARWLHFSGSDTTVLVPKGGIRLWELDEVIYRADPTPWNNRLQMHHGKVRNRRMHVSIGPRTVDAYATSLQIMPAMGWNAHDGFMAGAAFHSTLMFPRLLQFSAIPLYSFKQNSIAGIGEVRWEKPMTNSLFNTLTTGLRFRRFHYHTNDTYGFTDSYGKLEPWITLVFRSRTIHSHLRHSLGYSYAWINMKYGVPRDINTLDYHTTEKSYGIHQLEYHLENDYVLHPFDMRLQADAGRGFLRLGLQYRQAFPYNAKGHAVSFRAFAGILPVFDEPKANVSFQFNGLPGGMSFPRDYAFRELLFARNENKGVFSQQIWIRDAGLKTLSNVGTSSDWMVGFGADVRLPISLPVHAYADLALYPAYFEQGTQLSYSGGLSLHIAEDIFEIYIPLVESDDILDGVNYIRRNGFFERICFLLDLRKLNVFDLIHKGYHGW